MFSDTEGPMDVTFGAVTADENRVSVESRARARFSDGREYDNQVHFLLTLRDRRISSVKEYLDTEHLGRIFKAETSEGVSDNKAIARPLYEDVVGGKDLALLEELIAPDAIDYNGQKQGWPAGIEGFRRHVASFHDVFADLEVIVDDLVAEGERLVAFWTLRGIHRGELWGVPPTGRRVTGSTISILKIRGCQVVEYESRPDRLGLLLQLGSSGSYAEQAAAARAK
jgi:ketosteroid isomerase-like protein